MRQAQELEFTTHDGSRLFYRHWPAVNGGDAAPALVLLHRGKGGGLSDMFGGGMGAAAQGSTVVEKNLDRITVVAAVIFTFTTLGLGLMMSTPT